MKSGEAVIRPWEYGDFARLAAAGPGLSERTLWLRFWVGMPTLPTSYLRSAEKRWPLYWDAVAALDGDALIGWAEYGRDPAHLEHADIGVCVVDAEQGHGLGTRLLTVVIDRARGAGLVSVHADIAPYNQPARHAWRHATGSAAADYPLAS